MENEAKIEEKRIKSLVAAFLMMVRLGHIDKEKFILNRSLLRSVVTHYIQDLRILKMRYGITGKVLPPKTAGLIVAAIMRFKLVLPKDPKDEDLFAQDANELLAIFHGLCVCSELRDGKIDLRAVINLWDRPEFAEWLSDFRYLLKFRNYTAENLAMVFDTLIRFAK
ncbi:MAG: hypothetical protein LBC85_01795 [Fibromonadaceae bacterium]|jgi:hypothetical protein|nr:hypothetical protein [Fibromonadaceae bacterium]